MDLLWRGVEDDKARNAFRQALHRLRGAVGDDVLPQDRERLRLVPGERLIIDLDRFEAEVAAGRLAEAADACAGDFLENATLGEPPFDMWVEQERTRLRSRIARVLSDAASAAAAEGRWAEAVARTHRLLAIAPYEASSAQLAATTLISAGRRNEARELLKKFAATLDTELGLPMPPELQSLLSRLDRQPAPESESHARTRSASRESVLPFVGRENEISQLVTLCRTTAEEAGGFALIKGEAGIGKSRLLAELMANLRSLGRITVLHGREHVAGIQLPYAVFAEALRPLVRASGVLGASKHLLAEAARLLPELRDQIELPAVTDVEDEAGRLRFFEGIAALMDAAAFERPVVLIVDDAHLAGPSTLELLSYLCARLARSAVTLVFALRPSDAPASMLARLESVAQPDSQTHPGRALSIDLDALDARTSHDAVTRSLKGMGVEPAAVDRIVERAAGVPALLSDLVRRVSRGEPVASAPVSVREIVVDRVAALTSVQRRLLFVIALIGRPTKREVVGAAAHIPDAAVGDALDTLVAEGLIEVDAQGAITIDEGALHTALELAGASTRAFLSGWIADELALRSASPADLARFYAAAGQARPAFEQSRLAAFSALAVAAVPEATHHLHVARSFAQTPADVAAVESLLTAVGAGRQQIVTPTVAGAREHTQPQPAPVSPQRFEALFPNWHVLLGAAVATLAITSIVLADRASDDSRPLNLPTGDTLVVAEDVGQRVLRIATGDMSRGFVLSERRPALAGVPAWIDSLPRSWTNPRTAPRGQYVAIERMTAAGSDLFLISADRRDTNGLLVGMGDARSLGWSPDGRWLLASIASNGGAFDASLLALSGFGGDVERRVLEAGARRSVTEAAWSPDGTRIAWVARVGDDRQLEVFISNADGSAVRNVSRDPADDQHLAWSPDGKLLGFTSLRDGNAELYAHSFLENRLFRLTSDPAQDDGARFSTDGRLVAFESTRGGAAAVYVMPALGGDPQRIAAATPLSVVGWNGRTSRYVDRVLVRQPDRVRRGDTALLSLAAFDQFDEPLSVPAVQWRVLDSLAVGRTGGVEIAELNVVARGDGVARVIASVGGWRSDTALVALGSGVIGLLGRQNSARFWRALGAPGPTITDSVVILDSDREWESGVISRRVLPLIPGFVLQTALELPIADTRDPTASVTVSFVVPEDSANIDPVAPQFLRLASMSWNAESGRLVYAVGREFFSEPVAIITRPGESGLPIHIRVEPDSSVSFRIRSDERWRSTLRVLSGRQSSRAQVWVSSRATGQRARMVNPAIRLEPSAPSSR